MEPQSEKKQELDADGNPVEADPDAKEEGPKIEKSIYPESLISLNASQLFLKRRCKDFQKEQMLNAAKW
jgi:hypothetical protein